MSRDWSIGFAPTRAGSTSSSTTSGAARTLKQWNTPVWEHDLENGLRMLLLGVHTHLITAHHALPLLIERAGGLLVEVTDGTDDYNATHYRINPFYDLAKGVGRHAWRGHTHRTSPNTVRQRSASRRGGCGRK